MNDMTKKNCVCKFYLVVLFMYEKEEIEFAWILKEWIKGQRCWTKCLKHSSSCKHSTCSLHQKLKLWNIRLKWINAFWRIMREDHRMESIEYCAVSPYRESMHAMSVFQSHPFCFFLHAWLRDSYQFGKKGDLILLNAYKNGCHYISIVAAKN